jgi:hypothetical protein
MHRQNSISKLIKKSNRTTADVHDVEDVVKDIGIVAHIQVEGSESVLEVA